MHRDRPAGRAGVAAPDPVGPRNVEADFLTEGGLCQFSSNTPDRTGFDTAFVGDRVGRIFGREIALGHQMQHRCRPGPSWQANLAAHGGIDIGQMRADRKPALGIPGQWIANSVTNEKARIAGVLVEGDQPMGVGVTHEIIEIDLARAHGVRGSAP